LLSGIHPFLNEVPMWQYCHIGEEPVGARAPEGEAEPRPMASTSQDGPDPLGPGAISSLHPGHEKVPVVPAVPVA